MAVYVYGLMVGYQATGVDYALGIRSTFLRKTTQPVKYIFMDRPLERYIQRYHRMGVELSEMLSAPLFLADNADLTGKSKVFEKLQELMQDFGIDRIAEDEKGLDLLRNNSRIARMIFCEDRESFSMINYYQQERLIIQEHYAGRLLYTDYFVTAWENGAAYAKLVKTSFVNPKGIRVFDCIYEGEEEITYIYPDGRRLSKNRLMELFVNKLNLTEQDIVLIDRPGTLELTQPLFQFGGKAAVLVFIHSGHYFEKGEDPDAIYLNKEYYYWFKYSDRISRMIVSTEEQKKDLMETLKRYQCTVPGIEVIPVSGLAKLRYPEKTRKPYSLISVSRLHMRKRVHWVIESVMKAHQYLPELSLDVYGEGDGIYDALLKKKVEEHHAEDYIHFWGKCDVQDAYVNYEAYVTASLWETLGLSVMEAVGSGNAVIGLDVRYGNRLFIEDGKNGRRIPFDPGDSENPEKEREVVDAMADAIVELFRDEEKLRKYQEHSYEIAERFLNDKIEGKWIELIEEITAEQGINH